jgi:transmembrane sensor
MKTKKKYSIEELILDPSFQFYVLKTSQKDIEKWENYYLSNEDESKNIEQARYIIEMLARVQKVDALHKDTDYKRLLHAIEREERSKLSFQPLVVPVLLKRIKLAAIILVLIALGALGSSVYMKIVNNTSAESCSTLVGKGNKSKILLSDGTEVWLNSESSLSYPSHFGKNKREVKLVGEAYFKVKKDNSRQFIVDASEMRIKVFGTEFNIKSYPDEDRIYAILVSGSLSVQKVSANDNSQPIFLKPNQKVIFYRDQNKLSVTNNKIASSALTKKLPDTKSSINHAPVEIKKVELITEVNINNQIAWKDQRLIFRNESFEEIAKQVGRWYDMEIVFESDKIKKYKYTGVFENETIEQALNAMRYATLPNPFDYTIKNRTIYIKEKK